MAMTVKELKDALALCSDDAIVIVDTESVVEIPDGTKDRLGYKNYATIPVYDGDVTAVSCKNDEALIMCHIRLEHED